MIVRQSRSNFHRETYEDLAGGRLKSLRTRSLVTIVAVVTPVLLAFLLISHSHVNYQLSERFDRRMRGELNMLEQAVAKSGGDVQRLQEIVHLMPVDTFPHRRLLGIWADGERILASDDLPFLVFPPVKEGFDMIVARGDQWRTCSALIPATAATANRRFELTVAEPTPTRSALVRGALLDLILPLMVAVPLMIAGIYIALVRSLSPLTQLADQISRRSAEQLEPIAMKYVPSEVLPIAESVNNLMSRVGASLEREHRFTADAAHELRTPLTALKAHAQVALWAQDEQLRRETLCNIVRTVNRTDRLITQLLTVARLDPDASPPCADPVNLGQVAEQTVSELTGMAQARHQQLSVRADPDIIVRGSSEALAVLTRNVVENAILYSHDGGPIEVRVFRKGSHGVLEVHDRGPGIPDREKPYVFRRFWRITGSNVAGTGLGLSIVQRIAEIHGGNVSLLDGESGTGLRVRTSIPVSD